MTGKPRLAIALGAHETVGGGFVQSVNIAKCAIEAAKDLFEVECIAIDGADAESLARVGIPATDLGSAFIRKLEQLIQPYPFLRGILRGLARIVPRRSEIDAIARKRGYNLILFTNPSRQARDVVQTPFIYTIWDVCHRDHPEFPEIAGDGTFEWREELFRTALRRCVAFIVDTAYLQNRLAMLYGVDAGRAIVLPYSPSIEIASAPVLDGAAADALLAKYAIKRPYVFYPAQIWPHKNHAYLLRALAELKQRTGHVIDCVLSGSDRGNLRSVLALAESLGIADQVHYVGFVPSADMATLYRKAVALTMPTYFGPTNIPPLEAQVLGCPVIYSDKPGFRDFLGPDALYCDLRSVQSLSQCIETALTMPRPAPRVPAGNDAGSTAMREVFRRLAAEIGSWKIA